MRFACFRYMGQLSVVNEHLSFPPFQNVVSPSTQNMMAFSLHSYGKTSSQIASLGAKTAAAVAANRSLPLPAAYPLLPYAVTEHSSHTTASFSTLNSTYDTPYEASRLAAQILVQALQAREKILLSETAS